MPPHTDPPDALLKRFKETMGEDITIPKIVLTPRAQAKERTDAAIREARRLNPDLLHRATSCPTLPMVLPPKVSAKLEPDPWPERSLAFVLPGSTPAAGQGAAGAVSAGVEEAVEEEILVAPPDLEATRSSVLEKPTRERLKGSGADVAGLLGWIATGKVEEEIEQLPEVGDGTRLGCCTARSGKLYSVRSRLYRLQMLEAFESSRRDLHNALLRTALKSLFLHSAQCGFESRPPVSGQGVRV